MKKVAFIDTVHHVLQDGLSSNGFDCIDMSMLSRDEIIENIADIEGVVIRSKFPLDKAFLLKAKNLKFIARSGAGMENIDINFCLHQKIELFSAPEGNRNAVGEHALGMLLSLFNNLCKGNSEVRNGIWKREENRGIELDGKTVGIIGFGNNGQAFAKKLQGFDVEVLAYDKYKKGFGNNLVQEVGMQDIFDRADVMSLHIPQNKETINLINSHFIEKFKKSFYLINLSRGKIVNSQSLAEGLESNKVLGACLDVLEYEKSSFENLFDGYTKQPGALTYLLNCDQVLFSPHVGGWTRESYYKLSFVLLNKILNSYNL
ncbi:MAG: NAD(P)-dependent oxidoreductase [Crocinitomicaceae bacterium]